MSTELAIRPAVAVTEPHADMDFGGLLALSKELVSTGFLPQHIKTAGQAAAIILTGKEMGMGPMRAIRSLQMVKGKVIESADSQLARFKADGGRAVFTTLTETTAVLALKHPNGDEHTETFTLADAKRAGLDGSDTYRKFPKAMLRSRAITAGLKSVGWEGAVGNYDREEAATSFAPELSVDETRPSEPAGLLVETVEERPENVTEDGEVMGDAAEPEARSDAPTDKQVAFFKRLAESPVFTDEERAKALAWLPKATRQTIKGQLDSMKARVDASRVHA